MIDTDKYEGHTPAPWLIEDHTNHEENNGMRLYICSKDATFLWQCESTVADALLVADAPLLLAEVKKLRHELEIKKEALAKSQSSYKQLRKELKELIE